MITALIIDLAIVLSYKDGFFFKGLQPVTGA